MAKTKERRAGIVQRAFTERFKTARNRSKYTQYEVAKILKISQEAIAAYENERAMPHAEDLVAIALLFKVSTDYLLGVTRKQKSSNTPDDL